jgi:hypothetical protein
MRDSAKVWLLGSALALHSTIAMANEKPWIEENDPFARAKACGVVYGAAATAWAKLRAREVQDGQKPGQTKAEKDWWVAQELGVDQVVIDAGCDSVWLELKWCVGDRLAPAVIASFATQAALVRECYIKVYDPKAR